MKTPPHTTLRTPLLKTLLPGAILWYGLLSLLACAPGTPRVETVGEVMDGVMTRLYDQLDADELDTIGQDFILQFVSPAERAALATAYWRFEVNVPSIVSIMRDTAQALEPFWLQERGFHKTEFRVRNALYTYEVWQRRYEAGEVQLGINGFDRHRPVYFVAIAPVDTAARLQVTPRYPTSQHIGVLERGAFTYHDWDGLVLSSVPDALNGAALLTTIRGRAREAHVVGAIRSTDFPSSAQPDQITLTFGADAQREMTIQWRGAPSLKDAWVKYWTKHGTDTAVIPADGTLLEDRLLANDRYVSRYAVRLQGLEPGTAYEYMVGHEDAVSTVSGFTTAGGEKRFAFTWFGDIHNDKQWGDVVQAAEARHPESTFYLQAGDLVNTGLHRDDWDKLFGYAGDVFGSKPFMAVPGNHDSQDGLGASMYRSLLGYPDNGPTGLAPGLTYAFRYENALFLMIDAVSFDTKAQREWIEQRLAASDATWTFAVFHFPPYTAEEPYPDIEREWVPLFDRYGVDVVVNGHFHYYLRTRPMKGGKAMPDGAEGTIYLMSVGTKGKNEDGLVEPHAAKVIKTGYLYQHVRIDGNTLSHTCLDRSGQVLDYFERRK